jgi:ABC-type uncharacterized transport system substrate-binding protein
MSRRKRDDLPVTAQILNPYRYFVADGGLISYGPDTIAPFRRAASYVDRILKGEKPADLPVQAPVKYQTVLNMKTARALGAQSDQMWSAVPSIATVEVGVLGRKTGAQNRR